MLIITYEMQFTCDMYAADKDLKMDNGIVEGYIFSPRAFLLLGKRVDASVSAALFRNGKCRL